MPFNSIFGWIIKKRIHQIDLFRKHPILVQNEWLERLILRGRLSDFGRQYHFDVIEDYSSFSKKVPLQNYETLKPWIQRSIEGEESVLWPGRTDWFAKSSGTTSDKSKYIPVTKESLEECHYKGGKDMLAIYYHHYEDTQLFNGKQLILGGSAVQNTIHPERYTGDLSSIILKNLPWWVEIKRTPSKEIALMSEWKEKIERLAIETIDKDVVSIAGVPSWTAVLLKRILEKTGKKHIREVWPNLELFMHGGVNFEPYKTEFSHLIPYERMHYMESYNASEGFFGIQDEIGGDLLLMLDYGVFFEFIPMDKFDGINSSVVVPLKEIKLGKEYAMVISTNGGLWRYIIGDTIRFTNNSPYRFVITGRTKQFINAFGEELIVDNVERAMAMACHQTQARVKNYSVAPIYMENKKKGGHEWVIEFSKNPIDLKEFTNILDKSLKRINSDYEAKRAGNLSLDFPTVHIAREGLFEDWLSSKNKLGGQHKVPRLSNHREIVDELLQLF